MESSRLVGIDGFNLESNSTHRQQIAAFFFVDVGSSLPWRWNETRWRCGSALCASSFYRIIYSRFYHPFLRQIDHQAQVSTFRCVASLFPSFPSSSPSPFADIADPNLPPPPKPSRNNDVSPLRPSTPDPIPLPPLPPRREFKSPPPTRTQPLDEESVGSQSSPNELSSFQNPDLSPLHHFPIPRPTLPLRRLNPNLERTINLLVANASSARRLLPSSTTMDPQRLRRRNRRRPWLVLLEGRGRGSRRRRRR